MLRVSTTEVGWWPGVPPLCGNLPMHFPVSTPGTNQRLGCTAGAHGCVAVSGALCFSVATFEAVQVVFCWDLSLFMVNSMNMHIWYICVLIFMHAYTFTHMQQLYITFLIMHIKIFVIHMGQQIWRDHQDLHEAYTRSIPPNWMYSQMLKPWHFFSFCRIQVGCSVFSLVRFVWKLFNDLFGCCSLLLLLRFLAAVPSCCCCWSCVHALGSPSSQKSNASLSQMTFFSSLRARHYPRSIPPVRARSFRTNPSVCT